jgi:hypothetical protein
MSLTRREYERTITRLAHTLETTASQLESVARFHDELSTQNVELRRERDELMRENEGLRLGLKHHSTQLENVIHALCDDRAKRRHAERIFQNIEAKYLQLLKRRGRKRSTVGKRKGSQLLIGEQT